MFINLPLPVGLFLPVSIRYSISCKASLNLLPYIASILFKFCGENITSLFCCHSAKKSALLSPILLSLNKSEVIVSASQKSPGAE